MTELSIWVLMVWTLGKVVLEVNYDLGEVELLTFCSLSYLDLNSSQFSSLFN